MSIQRNRIIIWRSASYLKNGKIEDYFQNVVKKKKYKIGDAIKIAKQIKENSIKAPSELEGILKKILRIKLMSA